MRKFSFIFVGIAFFGLACNQGLEVTDPVSPVSEQSPTEENAVAQSDENSQPSDEVQLTAATAADKVPDKYRVRFETSRGDFVIEVRRAWSPRGAERFHELIEKKFFDECRFFRVLDKFVAQVGINGDPKVQAKWREANIKDDPVKESNKRGYVSFATGGPNTRTTQIFINYGDNSRPLDSMGFSPFGKVIKGMDVVDSLYKGYGEGFPRGSGPDQSRIQADGNAYLKAQFPKLDYIKSARVIESKKDAAKKKEAKADQADPPEGQFEE